MVNHDHNRIKIHGEGKISDKIDRELLERKQNRGQDRTEWRTHRVCVDLGLLANHTACNEMFDKGRETQPPEVTLKDRLGVENAM